MTDFSLIAIADVLTEHYPELTFDQRIQIYDAVPTAYPEGPAEAYENLMEHINRAVGLLPPPELVPVMTIGNTVGLLDEIGGMSVLGDCETIVALIEIFSPLRVAGDWDDKNNGGRFTVCETDEDTMQEWNNPLLPTRNNPVKTLKGKQLWVTDNALPYIAHILSLHPEL